MREGDERGQLLQELQRRECDACGPVRPRMREGIDEIAVSVFLEALQGHGPAGRIADEAFQLIAAMGWNLRVGMQGKALDAGTARTGEAWRLTLVAKAGTQAPDLLARPLPKGDALLDRGGHGAGE